MGQAVLLAVVAMSFVSCALLVFAFVAWQMREGKKGEAGGKKGAAEGTAEGTAAGGAGGASAVALAKAQLTKSADDYLGVWSSGASWTRHERGADWWTAGFMAGCWWRMHALTGDGAWKALAEGATAKLRSWAGKTTTHDVGFVIMSSFGNAPQPDAGVVKQAAGSLAKRYDAGLKLIKSWDKAAFTVIIDNMMNLKLLFVAAKLSGGQPAWGDMARQHALTSARELVRPNGSTWHKMERKGTTWSKGTHQGLNDGSTWARGQAWAIYGFAEAAHYTGDATLKATAIKCADFFLGALPADNVPPWDFSATDGIKDTSAAAIAACGLVKLSTLTGVARYGERGRAMVAALTANYQGSKKGYRSLLCCAVDSKPDNRGVGQGYVVADYYYLEALLLTK